MCEHFVLISLDMEEFSEALPLYKGVWDSLYRQRPSLSHLSQCFKSASILQQQDQLCDAVVKCGSREFRVHRVILAAASHYFRALYLFPSANHNLLEEHVADLSNFSASSVSLMLDMMYHKSELEGYHVDLMELIQLADYVQCEMILEKLLQVIGYELCPKNCFVWLNIAKQHNIERLKALVLQFIGTAMEDIMAEDAFHRLSLDSLKHVLEEPQLLCRPIPLLFEAVLSWCCAGCNQQYVNAGCDLARDLLNYCRSSSEDIKKILCLFKEKRFITIKDKEDSIFGLPNQHVAMFFSSRLNKGVAVFDSKKETVKTLAHNSGYVSKLLPPNHVEGFRNFYFVYRQQLYVVGQSIDQTERNGVCFIERYDPIAQKFSDCLRFLGCYFAQLPNDPLRLSYAVCQERMLYLFFHPIRIDARQTVLRKYNMDCLHCCGEQICFDADSSFLNVAFSHDGTLAVCSGLQQFYFIDQSSPRVVKLVTRYHSPTPTSKLESCDIAVINETYYAFVTFEDARSLLLVHSLDVNEKIWNHICSVDVVGFVYKVFSLSGEVFIIHSFLNYERCCECTKTSCCKIHLEEKYRYRCVSKFDLKTQTLEKLNVKLPEQDFQRFVIAIPNQTF